MRLAGLEGGAQRLARPEQVLLAYDFIEGSGPQLFGERRRRLGLAEEIGPLNFNPRERPPLWAG
ncbi:MAG TPA: hypothetical protein VMJ14_10740 [Burkholderiales bacterium]|nr:hypothetical protein [Burkholderiales bacterium]